MRRALLLVVMVSMPAWSQSPPPLPVPEPSYAPANQAPSYAPVNQAPSYMQQCFGYPSGLYLLPVPRVSASGGGVSSTSAGGTTSASGGSGSSGSIGSSGGGDGKALLVIAVLVAIALPVVVYALDEDASPVVQQRFSCPSFSFDLQGGLDTGVAFPGARPLGQGRFTLAFGFFGTDVQLDLSPSAVSVFSTHALLRIAPKQHIEGALSLGYRRLVVGNELRQGFDVGLPHRYAFWRDDLRVFGLELRPSLQFGPSGIDAAIEASLIVPIIELLHLRLGGRVYSFGNAIVVGATGGLMLGL
ncbi:MAG: hypothetical protein Q8L14_42235 [Myxococcales bacterium]|nr:hypothetical protein [Myxococcales bacterium]